MKFGRIPLAEAEGAILAHTLREGGVVLKKGRRLDAADLALLARAQLSGVVAARLEGGDVSEDDAAAAVASAIAGPGVRVAPAKTGRANLYAESAGMVVLDVQATLAINAVDEGLTLATLAPLSPARAGEMIATVKVIPFALPADVVRRAVAAASPATIAVRAFRPLRAAMLLTQLEGQPLGRIEQASRAVGARVKALGGEVVREVRCAHEALAIDDALRGVLELDVDVVLALGASAIVDRLDVIPSAFVAVGGAIDYVGMPVDPGNLICVGHLGACTLIGVPSCARSPKRSGFDMVLERVAAGLPCGRAEIITMSVGGLLPDIAARPRPRDGASDDGGRVAGLLLAAGSSRRMGARNKLLEQVDGAPMVVRSALTLAATLDGPIVVVTGHEAERVTAALADQGLSLKWAHNAEHERGLAGSLVMGLGALPEGCEAVLVALGDMPRVKPSTIEALCAAFLDGALICAPTYNGKRGNPVLWARRFFAEMRALTGDVGAKELLARHADEVTLVPVDDPGVLFDVDTEEALRALSGP